MNPIFRKQIAVESKILDGTTGLVEYVASDQSIDSYGEIIRADGWRFDLFQKNAPFLDSHNRDSIACVLGKVVDCRIEGTRLVETVQWAIDVPSNTAAKVGWEMTRAGYCCAVSVGFRPVSVVSKWDTDKKPWQQQLQELGVSDKGVNAIYVEQQQVELSAVAIGANENAVALAVRMYKDGIFKDPEIKFLSGEIARRHQTASDAQAPGHASYEAIARARRRSEIKGRIERLLQTL